ncbi:hypothetical protein [Streptomyces sp. NPDC017988]|uniref:hypothetical protein n=1 Tax=Streptomyces sp. NPDC017988 TaxID=3365025 RepID=UPI0037A44AB3
MPQVAGRGCPRTAGRRGAGVDLGAPRSLAAQAADGIAVARRIRSNPASVSGASATPPRPVRTVRGSTSLINHNGRLNDDATVLLCEWHGDAERATAAAAAARHRGAPAA